MARPTMASLVRCAGCLALFDRTLAQLWADELANYPDPPGRPAWRDELAQIDPHGDPQFLLDGGDTAVCLRCIRRARGENNAH